MVSFFFGSNFLFSVVVSMNPGDSKAMEGIQNVERANGTEVEHDSGDDEHNAEGVSIEEVSHIPHHKEYSLPRMN